uniref:Protein kinase domain-containing protein n=1 Tax=Nelumbo nucifera TaxID=4432 RepID=A0A822ZTA5_NELNU|nr:TPA_asm: hypothetical protein HUJ06_019091 [Nelumbo nucifera]
MAAVRFLCQSLFLFFSLSRLALGSSSDVEALLKLKKSFVNTKALDSWTTDSFPCTGNTPWAGVVCFNGFVTGLRLASMGLSGNIDTEALNEIPGLRTLNFKNNAFTGPIPAFNRLIALKVIYLSGNRFSGGIPSNYFLNMDSLKKVWLSGNEFTGKIPESLAKLSHLIELHLEDNHFSGHIPDIGQPSLVSLNMSNNKLEGEIPASLSKFGSSCFAGNGGLCGSQVGKKCGVDAMAEDSIGAISNRSNPNNAPEHNNVAAAALTLVMVVLLLGVGAIFILRKREDKFNVLGRENLDHAVEVHVPSSVHSKKGDSVRRGADSSSKRGSQNGKSAASMGELVIVNDEKGVFGLPDLMKAAAEVLGTGGLGSAYKAVMSNGVTVVVKRMKDMNRVGKDGFDMEMRRIGGLRHPNVLTPLAYYYRKEEKLLVYEYINKGSLLYLLHGDRGPSHAEFNWPARLKIVQGIARGMGYLHTELASLDLPHGNLKSSNILLNPNDGEPLLSDYGFCAVVSPTQGAQAMFAYKAPESLQYRHVSPKCDVYCLGIVILEILTGKFPCQYLNNGKGGTDVVEWVLSAMSEKRERELFDPEIASATNSLGEMERLLHIGAACTESVPEQRPDMKEAIRRIEEVQVEGSNNEGGGLQSQWMV